jgi:hypothetical protein
MPDFEREFRQLRLDKASEADKRVVSAYFAGMDTARKEVAVIAAIIGVLCVIGHL